MTDPPILDHRLTSLDASFLYLEQPNALLHVAGIYTFARPLDYTLLVSYVAERLHLIPRYTQRVMPVPFNLAHPTWEDDPDFDLERHILQHTLPAPGGDAELSTLCAELFAEPLDRSRPVWEMHLINGYGRGCAVFAKVHHCMIDGASGVQLINLLMDPTPRVAPVNPSTGRHAAPGSRLPSPFAQLMEGLVDNLYSELAFGRGAARALLRPRRALDEVRSTLDAVGTLVRTVLTSAPATPFNGPLSRRRTLAWTPLSLNEVKAIKNRLGGTVNDVVLAVIAGGLRHYLRGKGLKLDRTELRAFVPVNVRGEHEHLKLGNRVSMMVAPLPVGISDPIERLRQTSAAMELLKGSGQAGQLERLIQLTDILPPLIQSPLARLQASVSPVNTICTNVPGPRETRYLLGEPVQLMVPLVPLAAGIGLGFAIMSYSDQLTIGLNADAERVSDLRKLSEALRQSFDELWAVTGLERVVPLPPTAARPRRGDGSDATATRRTRRRARTRPQPAAAAAATLRH